MVGLGLSGGITLAGGVALGAGIDLGVIGLGVGLVWLLTSIVRGGRAVIIMEPTSVLLRFAAPRDIPFRTIARVDQVDKDTELVLRSGEKVRVPTSKLEDEMGAWLRKEIRKEIRLAAT
jgi:hypothetical protein